MSLKKGISKPPRPPPPKKGSTTGGISLSGFSFKQLEEDEDDEDLTAFTGKYDKFIEESQKAHPKRSSAGIEQLSSSPLVSSTNSGLKELKFLEKSTSETMADATQLPSKASGSLPVETNSPIRDRARAKLESSKELFSGLKEKIGDKISRTIEEFSGESSSSPSPDNEKTLTLPLQRSSSFEPVVKETATLLKTSGDVQDHPLANIEVEENFEDVIEPTVTKSSEVDLTNSDQIFLDPHDSEERDSEMFVFEEHFVNEPMEDFNGNPGFSTSTQLKSRSKIKRFMKKAEPKTLAVAHMSALHFTPDEEIASSIGSGSKGVEEKSTVSQHTNSEVKETSVASSSTSDILLRQLNLEARTVPYQRLLGIVVAVFVYLIFPMPSYLSGFIMGILLSTLGWVVYIWLMEPAEPPEPFILPPIEEPPPVPVMKTVSECEEYLYKGWMNELTDYRVDDYHINQTHCVFISLEGSHLRLQRPKNPVPKRAMFDEILPKPQYIHQRHFDLEGSSVFLLPQGLVKKRIWSKKYPICITLVDQIKNSVDDSKLKHISSEPSIAGKREKFSEMGFEIITEDKMDYNTLYLFARTGREKEEWFKRLSAASAGKPLGNHILEMKRAINQSSSQKKTSEIFRHKREGSTDSIASASSLSDLEAHNQKTEEGVDLLTFTHYMGRLMPGGSSRVTTPTHSSSSSKDPRDARNSVSKDGEEVKVVNPSGPIICDSQLFWINALIGRCFFDFLRDKWWIGKVTEKLQRKLSKIHVPYFIEELQVTDIHMGYEIPAIRHAGKPFLDERGFWVDLDITYSGGFKMTIETKMNLMKLKKSTFTSNLPGHSVDSKSPITDSEEEDSAESSTDEEEEAVANADESSSGGGASKKLLRYLNKITQSKYFQQATEYKVIKRAMENVSNTPLTLTVSVNSLVGKLAINIPPPPSDRLWYGFRGNPRLRLSAKPHVGERAVTIAHITEWIEKKLAIEFQRVFVMPNMDDLVIPILVPGEVTGATISRSVSL